MLPVSDESRLVAHPDAERPLLPDGPLWVFAYGSLLWRPDFPYTERLPARLYGYHRSLCVWSHVHRGTPEHPGMVLGLDRGGSCYGALYRVGIEHKYQVAEYLYAREMPTRIYRAVICPVRLDRSTVIKALTFIVDRLDHQYAGRLDAAEAARHVDGARGLSGTSREYLRQTLDHLAQLRIRDHQLEAIWAILQQQR